MVFVHVPKTAGSSFVALLRQRFGPTVQSDLGDLPMNTPVLERNGYAMRRGLEIAEQDFDGVDCIHGHFLAVKYLLLATRRPVTFVTWLRDPVDRLRSNYRYWNRVYDPLTTTARLHRRVCDEKWSLEDFCLSPEMRDMYSQVLWGFPLSYFDFVGVTEHFADDAQYFGRRFLGVDVVAPRLNASPDDDDHPIDAALRAKIEAFHERDVLLYGRALQLRHERQQ